MHEPMASGILSPAAAAKPPKRAYVTFLAGDGDYIKGVVGLAKGLRRAQSAYPLVVAVLPDVPKDHRRLLLSQGCIVREVEPLYPLENQTQFARADFGVNYSKLRIWNLVEYTKLIYLDADVQVFDTIDHLFDLPDGKIYAAASCFCEPLWALTPQYKSGYCQQKSPDANRFLWPEDGIHLRQQPRPYFNAGVFVFQPRVETRDRMLEALKATAPTAFAEQDFLNVFFKDVFELLPLEYNLQFGMLWRHPDKFRLEDVKVVHYCAIGSKPWRSTGKEPNMDREDSKMLVRKWWDIYEDPTLDYRAQ